MSDPASEVLKTLDDYASAFMTLVPENTLPYFHLPLMYVADAGVFVFDTSETLLGFLSKFAAGMKALKYARVNLSEREVTVLNAVTALVTFKVIRYNAEGGEIGRLGGAYTFRKEADRWKIVAAVLLAEATVKAHG